MAACIDKNRRIDYQGGSSNVADRLTVQHAHVVIGATGFRKHGGLSRIAREEPERGGGKMTGSVGWPQSNHAFEDSGIDCHQYSVTSHGFVGVS